MFISILIAQQVFFAFFSGGVMYQCTSNIWNPETVIYNIDKRHHKSFLPIEALQGQQSKQKLPQVRIPQPQEGMQMNRISQNPLPCRLQEPVMTSKKQPTLPVKQIKKNAMLINLIL